MTIIVTADKITLNLELIHIKFSEVLNDDKLILTNGQMLWPGS
jgi:hypothetical protein